MTPSPFPEIPSEDPRDPSPEDPRGEVIPSPDLPREISSEAPPGPPPGIPISPLPDPPEAPSDPPPGDPDAPSSGAPSEGDPDLPPIPRSIPPEAPPGGPDPSDPPSGSHPEGEGGTLRESGVPPAAASLFSDTNFSGSWSDRIVGFERGVSAVDLQAHPENARLHPVGQREALVESLERVGWVDVVKVNRRTGRILDGHLRVEEAAVFGAEVPVVWLDLDEDEERWVLATLDPISALATYDAEGVAGLLDRIPGGVSSEELAGFLADQAVVVLPDAWSPGDSGVGDGDSGGGEGHEDEVLWPTVAVRCSPELFSVWNSLVGDGDPAEVFEGLVRGAAG